MHKYCVIVWCLCTLDSYMYYKMNGQTIDFEKQTNVAIVLGKHSKMHMQPAQTFCSLNCMCVLVVQTWELSINGTKHPCHKHWLCQRGEEPFSLRDTAQSTTSITRDRSKCKLQVLHTVCTPKKGSKKICLVHWAPPPPPTTTHHQKDP